MKSKILFLLLLFVVEDAQAQLSGSNIMDYQLGNVPHAEPSNRTTLYDQLNLSYYYGAVSGHVRLEYYQSQSTQSNYAELTQRSLRLSDKGFEIAVGNFYEIFGRGLLLRSYELPGTILEDFASRTRYGFYRDIDGFLLKYLSNYVELKALRGKPLRNDLPPSPLFEDLRRSHLIEGAEANLVFIEGWSFGGSYLRDNFDEDFDGDNEYAEYSTFFVSGNLPLEIQIYSEYATKLGKDNTQFDLSDNSAHGFYSSANIIQGPVGLSLEYKDYNDLLLDYNDPPPAIREHSYKLLNRGTHVLIPINETGWQAEMVLTTSGGHSFTANATEAENNFSEKYLYKEVFAEVHLLLNEWTSLKGYFDRSQDPIKLEYDRYITGFYVENDWPRNLGTILDLQFQTFNRETTQETQKVENYLASFTLTHSPKYSAGILWERTTDPVKTDDPTTDERETDPRNWIGCTVTYQYSPQFFFALFFGKRRGGLACDSGICYQILDFEGLELRVSSLF